MMDGRTDEARPDESYSAVIRLPDGTTASAKVRAVGVRLAYTPVPVNGSHFHHTFEELARFDGTSFLVLEVGFNKCD